MRLRITARSAIVAVGLFGLTLAVLGMAAAARRVLGWIAGAAALACLLYPLVSRLGRHIPRGLAVISVVLASVATTGGVAWLVVDDIREETERLRRAAPEAASRIENDDGRLAELAREAKLAERTQRFVDEVPERLRGGTPAQALRSAATRFVAYLATGVLTIFFLLHGPKLAAALAAQLRDPRRRSLVERAGGAAYGRGFGYARGTIAMSLAAGVYTYAVAAAFDVPGAAPLAVWVALWDVVPYFGALVAAVPVIVLGGVGDTGQGVVLALAFLGYQLVESFVAQPRLERRTVRVGPFLTSAGAFAGLELYGLGGAMLALLVLALATAVLDEVAPRPPPAPALPAPAPAPSPQPP